MWSSKPVTEIWNQVTDMKKKVCFIGGGSGISQILRGLKHQGYDLSAIVTMTDDGGGSGMIRSQWGLLPPGDLRNCLIALANTEPTMSRLINYRYKQGPLKGQNFGNLLIATLSDMYGSFEQAVEELSQVLKVSGQVLPVTLDKNHLVARFANGERCIGESAIPKVALKQKTHIDRMELFPGGAKMFYHCEKILLDADAIVLGPGSLYTSVIPNLLVDGMVKALKKSKAKKILLMNIMTQPGETDSYSLTDHIRALEAHSYPGLLDACLVNKTPLSEALRASYQGKNRAEQIFLEKEERRILEKEGLVLVTGDFLDQSQGFARHKTSTVDRALKKFLLS